MTMRPSLIALLVLMLPCVAAVAFDAEPDRMYIARTVAGAKVYLYRSTARLETYRGQASAVALVDIDDGDKPGSGRMMVHVAGCLHLPDRVMYTDGYATGTPWVLGGTAVADGLGAVACSVSGAWDAPRATQ